MSEPGGVNVSLLSQGMILMYAKEGINESLLKGGVSPTLAGIAAGAGGGIAQVSVMGPTTYLVTGRDVHYSRHAFTLPRFKHLNYLYFIYILPPSNTDMNSHVCYLAQSLS